MVNSQKHVVRPSPRLRARARVAATLLLSIGFALAAPGDLDPSFNGRGRPSLRVGDHEGSATAVVQQTDGKLVLAGWGRLNGSDNEDFIVMRVAEDGTRDSTFGTNGVASADFTGFWDSANAVIQQSDGKLVLAGEAGGDNGPGRSRWHVSMPMERSIRPSAATAGHSLTSAAALVRGRRPCAAAGRQACGRRHHLLRWVFPLSIRPIRR